MADQNQQSQDPLFDEMFSEGSGKLIEFTRFVAILPSATGTTIVMGALFAPSEEPDDQPDDDPDINKFTRTAYGRKFEFDDRNDDGA